MGRHNSRPWFLRRSTNAADLPPFDLSELSSWNWQDTHARYWDALARARRQRNLRADGRWERLKAQVSP